MKKIWMKALIVFACIALAFGGLDIWLSNLRMPVKGNVIFANDAIQIAAVFVNDNHVHVTTVILKGRGMEIRIIWEKRD